MAKRIRKRIARRKRAKKVKASTMKKVVKKVRMIDSIDNCYKSGSWTELAIPSMVGAPSTQLIQNTATGLIQDFTDIDSNIGSNDRRLRNKVQLKSLSVRMHIKSHPNSNISTLVSRAGYKVRTMIVLQKVVGNNQSNSFTNMTYPSIAQLLYVNGTCASSDLLAHPTWVNKTNFRILYDSITTLPVLWKNVPEAQTNYALGVHKESYIKTIRLNLSKIPPVEYQGAVDGSTNICSHRLLLVMYSDNVNANTYPVLLDMDYRLNYDN